MGTSGQLDGSLPLPLWASVRPCIQRRGRGGGVEGPRSTSQARGAGKVIIEFRGTSPSPAGESGKRNYTNPGTASPQCKSRTERVLGLEKSHSIGKKTN